MWKLLPEGYVGTRLHGSALFVECYLQADTLAVPTSAYTVEQRPLSAHGLGPRASLGPAFLKPLELVKSQRFIALIAALKFLPKL